MSATPIQKTHFADDDTLAYIAKLESELAAARESALEEAEEAVIRGCEACGGNGYTVTTVAGYGHGCGGDAILCQTVCPVPVPEQSQVQCEYCERPAQAIRAIKKAAG